MLQNKDEVKSGYVLTFLGDRWELRGKHYAIEGSWQQVCQLAVFDLEFEAKDLNLARMEMAKYKHDSAMFGIFKHFMWTFKRGMQNAG